MKRSKSPPADDPFFQKIKNMREVLCQGQTLSAHLNQPPNWALHHARLNEIERLFRLATPESLQQMAALNEDFLLDMQADIAQTVAETSSRLIRTTDKIARAAEEKKFELPSKTRDDLDDLLQPYHDGIRDQVLSQLPLEERLNIEEERRRLDNHG